MARTLDGLVAERTKRFRAATEKQLNDQSEKLKARGLRLVEMDQAMSALRGEVLRLKRELKVASGGGAVAGLQKRILALESARFNDALSHKGAMDALRERGNELAHSLGRLVTVEENCDLSDAEFERRMDAALAAARVRMRDERRRAVVLARHVTAKGGG